MNSPVPRGAFIYQTLAASTPTICGPLHRTRYQSSIPCVLVSGYRGSDNAGINVLMAAHQQDATLLLTRIQSAKRRSPGWRCPRRSFPLGHADPPMSVPGLRYLQA